MSFVSEAGASRAIMSPPIPIRADTRAIGRLSQSPLSRSRTCRKRLFDAHHDAVGDPARIHHGQPCKAGPVGREEQACAGWLPQDAARR